MATNQEMAAKVEALEKRIDDLQRQSDALFAKHGLPRWQTQEKQRRENEAAAGTKLPFTPNQHYRPKDHEAK